jgi:hypothetical protein
MDFIKLLRSLEELLYEVMVMLVFYPRTLWLTIRHPQRMMDYADTELGDVQSEQYDDTVSPPLFLMISLGIAHLIGQAAKSDVAGKLPGLLANVENLLALRLLLFSLFPLMMALRLLARLDVALNRESLRPPFYSQCVVTAPVAMAVGLCQSVPRMLGLDKAVGVIALLFVLAWYLRQQAAWFGVKLSLTPGPAWRMALSTAILSTLAATAISTIVMLVLLDGKLG